MTSDRTMTRKSIDDAIAYSYTHRIDKDFNTPSFDLWSASGEVVFQVQKQFFKFHTCEDPDCDNDPKCPRSYPWEGALLEMYKEAQSAIERDFLASAQLHLRRLIERFALDRPEALR